MSEKKSKKGFRILKDYRPIEEDDENEDNVVIKRTASVKRKSFASDDKENAASKHTKRIVSSSSSSSESEDQESERKRRPVIKSSIEIKKIQPQQKQQQQQQVPEVLLDDETATDFVDAEINRILKTECFPAAKQPAPKSIIKTKPTSSSLWSQVKETAVVVEKPPPVPRRRSTRTKEAPKVDEPAQTTLVTANNPFQSMGFSMFEDFTDIDQLISKESAKTAISKKRAQKRRSKSQSNKSASKHSKLEEEDSFENELEELWKDFDSVKDYKLIVEKERKKPVQRAK